MSENNSAKSFWGSLPGVLTGLATLLTAIIAAIAYFHNLKTDTHKASESNGVYQSYFADVDKGVPYLSIDGVVNLKISGHELKGETTVNDLRVAGQLSKTTWKFSGYVDDNYMYIAYDTGVAILKNFYKDYVGYWFGENYDGSMLKCPYVLSRERLSKTQAQQKWPLLNRQCEILDIMKK